MENFENYKGEMEVLYQEAIGVVISENKGSTSLLQRRLKIGYAKAAKLIDMLEDKGILGHMDGAKPRELLLKVGIDIAVKKS